MSRSELKGAAPMTARASRSPRMGPKTWSSSATLRAGSLRYVNSEAAAAAGIRSSCSGIGRLQRQGSQTTEAGVKLDLGVHERTFVPMRDRSGPRSVIFLTASLAVLACHPEGTAAPIDLTNISGPALIFDDVHVFDGVDDLGVIDVVVEGETISHIGTVDLTTLPPA